MAHTSEKRMYYVPNAINKQKKNVLNIQRRKNKMKKDRRIEDTLRGQKFIGKLRILTDPRDGLYEASQKDPLERSCSMCFYRYGHEDVYATKEDRKDCAIVCNPTPHELFGFKKGEYLPEQLDGKEVGNYCPH